MNANIGVVDVFEHEGFTVKDCFVSGTKKKISIRAGIFRRALPVCQSDRRLRETLRRGVPEKRNSGF